MIKVRTMISQIRNLIQQEGNLKSSLINKDSR